MGERVKRDDVLLDVETEKVVIEIFAPADGVVAEILKAEGDVVESEDLLGRLREVEADEAGEPAVPRAEAPPPAPVAASPAARKLAAEEGIDLAEVDGSGRDGRITKDDVQRTVNEAREAAAEATEAEPEPAATTAEPDTGERVERRVPMTRLRASIAARLVEAQQTAAMLTTFNEVDMGPIMTMRRRYGDEFRERHNGTKLGFMSFFVRACVESLKRFPAVNATIDGNDIVYHGFYDIGVAVSTERGLVVPVIRDADALGMHQIEDAIVDYSARARDGKLALEDMQGGTFTISNGACSARSCRPRS